MFSNHYRVVLRFCLDSERVICLSMAHVLKVSGSISKSFEIARLELQNTVSSILLIATPLILFVYTKPPDFGDLVLSLVPTNPNNRY